MKTVCSNAPLASQRVDLLAVGVGSDLAELKALSATLGIDLSAWATSRGFTGKTGTAASLATLGKLPATDLVFVGMGARAAADHADAAARAGREARTLRARTVAVDLGASSEAIFENFAVGNYAYQVYQRETDRTPSVAELTVIGDDVSSAASLVRARWQSWARDLVNAPPAELYPESLAAAARAIEAHDHVEIEVWDKSRLEREGCVGILAVGQGSVKPPCLIHIRYRPPGARDHIAFVGKGVTFDAGGLSIKPSAGMQTMRCDMGGAALVLGATGAAAELGLPIAIDCFVAAAENLIDGDSYKLSDILRYRNGVNVEIHNTDAEGRLVMADALLFAGEVDGVTAIIDAATLTGACVVALGSDFTGLFTDHEGLADELSSAAKSNTEGMWRLPLHAPYKAMLKAEWGTIKNVGSREAGATTAALFLQHFVPEGMPWAHLDIAGQAFHEKANNKYAAGGTGELVRSLVSWLASRAS